jgi:hypothetical protein
MPEASFQLAQNPLPNSTFSGTIGAGERGSPIGVTLFKDGTLALTAHDNWLNLRVRPDQVKTLIKVLQEKMP